MTPLRVGLTGGIGCGKSTVAALFANLGVTVIDADEISRELVRPGRPALNRIVRLFGSEILIAGELDRRALRRRIFAEPALRRALEDLLHPLVYRDMAERASCLGAPYCILSVPLLLETAPPHFVDRVLVIDCSIENQIRRTQARDKIPEQEVRRIIDAQISRAARLKAADDVLDNDGALPALRRRIAQLHVRYLQLARARQSDPLFAGANGDRTTGS